MGCTMKRAAASSILVAVVLLAVAVKAEAQQPKKVSRLGYLSNTDSATDSPRAEGIRLALRELFYDRPRRWILIDLTTSVPSRLRY